MNKISVQIKKNQLNQFHSEKKLIKTNKIQKITSKIQTTDEKLFLKNVEKLVEEEIFKQKPLDWKSFFPIGNDLIFYERTFEKYKSGYAQVSVTSDKEDENKINVHVVFGIGFSFDLLDFDQIKKILDKHIKTQLKKKLTTYWLYANQYCLPTWNHLTKNWREGCMEGFGYRKRPLTSCGVLGIGKDQTRPFFSYGNLTFEY